MREALAGKVNVHHPPENCGGSARVLAGLHRYLGDYEAPGRHWDVVAFNVGHWNLAMPKEIYQEALRKLIERILVTGARVLWIATTPVGFGLSPLAPRPRPVARRIYWPAIKRLKGGSCAALI